jgi:hypothetical protein
MEDDFQEEPPPTISAIAGHIVMINCSGPSAYPPITQVTWYKWNSSGPFPISQTSRVQIRENGQLVFENPMQTDSGPYFCGVSNGVFSRNSSSTLLFVNTGQFRSCDPVFFAASIRKDTNSRTCAKSTLSLFISFVSDC